MKIDKLPTAEKMKAEYNTLTTDKENLYAKYKPARKSAGAYSIIKQNVDSLLSVPKELAQEKCREMAKIKFYTKM